MPFLPNEAYMMRNLILSAGILISIGCTNRLHAVDPAAGTTQSVPQASPSEKKSLWSVYDLDPDHPWNRVFRQLYRRTTADGKEYGADELDPLLWFDTIYLLNGPSHEQALRVLDEFLSTHAENLIRDPLKRAMFQRDLWAVFDWSASQAEPYPSERQALQTRLAQIVRRVALSKEQIDSLPDNYTLEIRSHTFLTVAPPNDPDAPFLPSDLLQADSAWVPVGREGGPVAMTHTESAPFFGRSVFLVFLRSPDGREASLRFLHSLNSEPHPRTAIGSDVALVRRMLLIDDQGNLILSPLVETIQIRLFNPEQHFHEFELNRMKLFGGKAGGLVLNDDLFMLFMSHGDVFENSDIPELQAAIPKICKACHFEDFATPYSGSTSSIVSYSRQPFPLRDNQKPALFPTSWSGEARTVIEWKRNHETWKSLQALWGQSSP